MNFKETIFILMFLFTMPAFAKRVAPLPVDPVTHKGIVYSTFPWSYQNGSRQNGGFIKATIKSTGDVIWEKQIYKTKYKRGIETDIQDVFITTIKLTDDASSLVIINEIGDVYSVILKNQMVIKK